MNGDSCYPWSESVVSLMQVELVDPSLEEATNFHQYCA